MYENFHNLVMKIIIKYYDHSKFVFIYYHYINFTNLQSNFHIISDMYLQNIFIFREIALQEEHVHVFNNINNKNIIKFSNKFNIYICTCYSLQAISI